MEMAPGQVEGFEEWEEEKVLRWGHELTTSDVVRYVRGLGFQAWDVGTSFRRGLSRAEREVFDDWKQQEVRTFVTSSETHGYGLFVGQAVPQGKVILEYTGVRFPVACKEMVCEFYASSGVESDYFFEESGIVTDATLGGSNARFANNHCNPNAYFVSVRLSEGNCVVFIMADRDIPAGAEVFVRYNFVHTGRDLNRIIICACDAPNCYGRV